MDDVLLYGLISKSKKPDDYAVVGKYLSVEPYGIMLRRTSPRSSASSNKRAHRSLPVGRDPRGSTRSGSRPRDLTVPMNQYLKEAFVVPNTYPAWP